MASGSETIFPTTVVFGDTTSALGGPGSNFLQSNSGSLYFNGSQVNTGSNIFQVATISLMTPQNGSNITFASNLVFRGSSQTPSIGGGFQYWTGDNQLYFEGQPMGGRSNIIQNLTANNIYTESPQNQLFIGANLNCNNYFFANTAGISTTSNLNFTSTNPNITYSGGTLSVRPTGTGGTVKFYGAANQSNIWLVSTDPGNGAGTDVGSFNFIATGDTSNAANTHCLAKITVSQSETLDSTTGGGGTFQIRTRNPFVPARNNQGDSDPQVTMFSANSSASGNVIMLGPNAADSVSVGIGVTPSYPFQVGSQFYVDTNLGRTVLNTLGFQGDVNMSSISGSSRVLIGASGAGSQSTAIGKDSNPAGTSAVAVGFQAGGTGNFQIAMGYQAGQLTSQSNVISIGYQAGQTSQGQSAVALGFLAGTTSQGAQSIAIGESSGLSNQGSQAISIGYQAGQSSQGLSSVSIGYQSARTLQGSQAAAIGYQAGSTSQGSQSLALGYQAGQTTQGVQAFALGYQAGQSGQSDSSAALGYRAGQISQGVNSTAIGVNAGTSNQGLNSVAIGTFAGTSAQGSYAIAIGNEAGILIQNAYTVAIGYQAGQSAQHSYSVAIGTQAGRFWNGSNCISVGYQAGYSSQGQDSMALGTFSGQFGQDIQSLAIGTQAGQSTQGSQASSIGYQAGQFSQGFQATAIGAQAGQSNQSSQSLALGYQAGQNNQGIGAMAIGVQAGQTGQGVGATAIGYQAGRTNQLTGTTAIGYQAGQAGMGSYSISVGFRAGAASSVPPYTIVLNASGNDKLIQTSGSFNVFPVRVSDQPGNQSLSYNQTTGEIYTTTVLTTNSLNVGISNLNPSNTLSVGKSFFVQDGTPTTVISVGNVVAPNFFGSGLWLSNIAGATTAGVYGTATSIPVITVDSSGRINSVTSAAALPTGNLAQITAIGNVTTQSITTGGLVTTGGVSIGNVVTGSLLNVGASTAFNDALNTIVTTGNVVANQYIGSAALLSNVVPPPVGGSDIDYGSSSQVPVIRVRADGKILGITTTAVTGSQTLETTMVQGNQSDILMRLSNAFASLVTTTNVGIANVNPTRTLSVGSNLWVSDTGSTLLYANGTSIINGALGATNFFGNVAGSNTINAFTVSATSFIGSMYGNLVGSNTVNASTISATTFLGTISGSNAISISNSVSATSLSGTFYGALSGSNAVSASTISVSGNASVANSALSSVTLTVGSNLFVSDTSSTLVTAKGNISANYFVGDGSLLTGLPPTPSLNQVVSVGNTTSNTLLLQNPTLGLAATGNIQASYFTGNASSLVSLTGASAGTYGNGIAIPGITVDANGRITSVTSTRINQVATGVQNQVGFYSSSNTVSGSTGLTYNSTNSSLTLGGSLNVGGDLTISGVTYSSNNVVLNDTIFLISNNSTNAMTRGILMQRPAGNVMMAYLSSEAGGAYNNTLVLGHTFGNANGPLLTPDTSNALNVLATGKFTAQGGLYGSIVGSNAISASSLVISAGGSITGNPDAALGVITTDSTTLQLNANTSTTGQGLNAVSIGNNAGSYNQGSSGIAVGVSAGLASQGDQAIAMGINCGLTSQGDRSIAIGSNTGGISQGSNAIAIGSSSGNSSQGSNAIAIGFLAGNGSQGVNAVAIGTRAGQLAGQGSNSIAIGSLAGYNNQGAYCVAIGDMAGQTSQFDSAIAIGIEAGQFSQAINVTAIGYQAGQSNQQQYAVSVGDQAGQQSQGVETVSIGSSAGQFSQNNYAVSVGSLAGRNQQGYRAIAVGYGAGVTTQQSNAIAIGCDAGKISQQVDGISIGALSGGTQGSRSVAIGLQAGAIQGASAVAIGTGAGGSQANQAVAIGFNAGGSQNQYAIAIGNQAGAAMAGTQGSSSVAIGYLAGSSGQGNFSVAIGLRAGQTGQGNNSIIINAANTGFSPTQDSSFFVNPVRLETTIANTSNLMVYNNTTNEIMTVPMQLPAFSFYSNSFAVGTGAPYTAFDPTMFMLSSVTTYRIRLTVTGCGSASQTAVATLYANFCNSSGVPATGTNWVTNQNSQMNPLVGTISQSNAVITFSQWPNTSTNAFPLQTDIYVSNPNQTKRKTFTGSGMYIQQGFVVNPSCFNFFDNFMGTTSYPGLFFTSAGAGIRFNYNVYAWD